MRRQSFLSLKSLGVCSTLFVVGCGGIKSPVLSGPDRLPAPRKIELPANIRPLIKAEPAEHDDAEGGPVPAQYQQPPEATPSQPRITAVSTAPISEPSGAASGSYWGNPRGATTNSATMPRGDFVPMGSPPASMMQPPGQPSASRASVPAQIATAPRPQFAAPRQSVYAAPSQAYPLAPTPPSSGPELGAPNGRPMPVAPHPAASPPQPSQQNGFIPSTERTSQFVPSQSQASPSAGQVAVSSQQGAAMQAVGQQAMQMANQAGAMAQRGMLYSANTELVKSLTLISQALDVQQNTTAHATALSAGLAALEEARDFASASSSKSGGTDVAAIAATHRTKLTAPIAPSSSPVVAQQQYFAFAQQQLVVAGGGLPASSEILFRLGRLQTAMATHDNDPAALHGPQAIVFHQAALTTDGHNWLAANELGVLYARYGQLPQARQLLVQSVTIHPHRSGWQNLAVVHRRLGEIDLAQRAEAEVQSLDKQPSQATGNDMVRWVDPKTFATSGGGESVWPANATAKTATTSGTTRR